MAKAKITRWTCDLNCGRDIETPINAEKPKEWEYIRVPTITKPKRKSTTPRRQMKRLLICQSCLKEMQLIVDNWTSIVGLVEDIVDQYADRGTE